MKHVVNPVSKKIPFDQNKLPANYSSDHRLSGFGALSGGLTVSKQFAKGVSFEIGAEYYTHAGSLKLGGGGEAAYADYSYYTVNGVLKVDLSALSCPAWTANMPDMAIMFTIAVTRRPALCSITCWTNPADLWLALVTCMAISPVIC